MKSRSLFLLTLDSSKSFLFDEVSLVDDFNRIMLILDKGLLDDRNMWMLALVTLNVLVFHELNVIPTIVNSVQALMGESQSWRSASTRSTMKINSLVLLVDQIVQLGRCLKKLLDVIILHIIRNLVSLVLDTKGSELLLYLLLRNVSLLDFAICLKTEYGLDFMFLNEVSDFINTNWGITNN